MSATPSNLRERLANACLDLLRIPSVTGEEHEIVNFLERWGLQQPSLTRGGVIRHGNGLIIGQTSDTKPCIALVGHVDTVPPVDGDPGVSRDGDRIVGRGASDMKGSVAVMQMLYEVLDIDALPFALLLVLYDREEGSYNDNGLQPLLESYDALRNIDLAIAMEPTDNTLQLGCVGSIQARITFSGRAAHSARPWQGDNAVHKAGPLLTHLQQRHVNEVLVEGLTFREAMSVTLIDGGKTRNVIPDHCRLNLNYRFAPEGDPEDKVSGAIAEIKRLARDADVEILDIAPPGPVPVDNPILEHFQSHAHLPVEPKQAWTDVARLAAHGIDAVNYGPGAGAQAHQAGEWMSLDEAVKAYEVLARVLTAPLEGL